MGNAQGGPPPNPQGEEKKEDEPKKKVSVVLERLLVRYSRLMRYLKISILITGRHQKFNPVMAARGGRRRKKKGPATGVKLPDVFPTTKCKLRLLKLQRIKVRLWFFRSTSV